MHALVRDDVLGDVAELLDSGAFTNGPQVEQFERRFASWCGTAECVGTGSGLDAIRLALIAMGIGQGDEVIVPALTFVATLEAVTQAGAIPVPVDIGESDYGVDPAALEAAVGPRTRAIIPVHLYGQMPDMVALRAIAARHDLVILEDACQAHGATRDGLGSGSSGTAGAFSFYPAKNLGAIGDAGALVTDDAELASTVRALREHGQRGKYRHEYEGYTSRLDTIQALVLLHKLPHLAQWNDERRAIAATYGDRLAGVGDLIVHPVARDSHPVWHLYVVRTSDPSALADYLASHNVATGRHYPEPPHLAPAYAWLGFGRGSFPLAERVADECLSLPIFPGMTERQVEAVIAAVTDYFSHG